MVPRKKKYESGEASNYITRKNALYKLQLNLKDFRCGEQEQGLVSRLYEAWIYYFFAFRHQNLSFANSFM